ncbi:MAG: TIGR01440 family protein [Oscillospiraceae bacterium]|nr:TIGR01440 family protein [Oscillospiraceae bacterium]
MFDEIRAQAAAAAAELCEKAGLKKGQIMAVGCSTSEVAGSKIGTDSNYELAQAVFGGIYDTLQARGIYLAAQCCEHLNRAIIIERSAVPFAEPVNAVPQPKAGGSFATSAYRAFDDPIAVEEIKADAGMDIGRTLIGMHLKKVAVPCRLDNDRIGEAIVIAARTRPKYIGGERAVYDERLK